MQRGRAHRRRKKVPFHVPLFLELFVSNVVLANRPVLQQRHRLNQTYLNPSLPPLSPVPVDSGNRKHHFLRANRPG